MQLTGAVWTRVEAHCSFSGIIKTLLRNLLKFPFIFEEFNPNQWPRVLITISVLQKPVVAGLGRLNAGDVMC